MSRTVSGDIEISSYYCRKCGTLHFKGNSVFVSHMKHLFSEWKETITPEKVVFT